jgi:hypothetical protein
MPRIPRKLMTRTVDALKKHYRAQTDRDSRLKALKRYENAFNARRGTV